MRLACDIMPISNHNQCHALYPSQTCLRACYSLAAISLKLENKKQQTAICKFSSGKISFIPTRRNYKGFDSCN